MKTAKHLLLYGLLCLAMSIASVAAANPPISPKHSDANIDVMLAAARSQGWRDTAPTNSLSQQLKADFPKASDIEWESAANLYCAEFEVGRMDCKAYYDADCNLIMYVAHIPMRDVPEAVKAAAKDMYPTHRIDEAKMIERGTKTFYELELEDGREEVNVTFDSKAKRTS